MIANLATLLVFGLAFVVLPFGSSWYEIPKVLVAWAIVLCLSAVFFWKPENVKKMRLTLPVLVVFSGFVILTLWSLLFMRTQTTLFGNAFRLQGVFTFGVLLLWSVISPMLVTTKKRFIFALSALLIMVVSSIVGITDAAGRAVGLLGEANSFGAFAVFLFPFATGKRPYIAFVLALIVIFFSGSRSAFIGLLAAGSIVFLSQRIGLHKSAILAAVILIASLFLPFFGTRQVFDDRAVIWRTAIEAGMEKPILGWGIGNIEGGLKEAAERIHTSLRFQYVDSSHNVFLDWWVQGGIVGVGLFTTLLTLSISSLLRKKESILLASLLGILSVMLFNPVSIAILIPFWWILGTGLHKT